jgi:hypothetical protein
MQTSGFAPSTMFPRHPFREVARECYALDVSQHHTDYSRPDLCLAAERSLDFGTPDHGEPILESIQVKLVLCVIAAEMGDVHVSLAVIWARAVDSIG